MCARTRKRTPENARTYAVSLRARCGLRVPVTHYNRIFHFSIKNCSLQLTNNILRERRHSQLSAVVFYLTNFESLSMIFEKIRHVLCIDSFVFLFSPRTLEIVFFCVLYTPTFYLSTGIKIMPKPPPITDIFLIILCTTLPPNTRSLYRYRL